PVPVHPGPAIRADAPGPGHGDPRRRRRAHHRPAQPQTDPANPRGTPGEQRLRAEPPPDRDGDQPRQLATPLPDPTHARLTSHHLRPDVSPTSRRPGLRACPRKWNAVTVVGTDTGWHEAC